MGAEADDAEVPQLSFPPGEVFEKIHERLGILSARAGLDSSDKRLNAVPRGLRLELGPKFERTFLRRVVHFLFPGGASKKHAPSSCTQAARILRYLKMRVFDVGDVLEVLPVAAPFQTERFGYGAQVLPKLKVQI
jgi:hypothetical protein